MKSEHLQYAITLVTILVVGGLVYAGKVPSEAFIGLLGGSLLRSPLGLLFASPKSGDVQS